MRVIIIIAGVLLSASIPILNVSALADDRTRDIRCDKGFHWDDTTKSCVPNQTK